MAKTTWVSLALFSHKNSFSCSSKPTVVFPCHLSDALKQVSLGNTIVCFYLMKSVMT